MNIHKSESLLCHWSKHIAGAWNMFAKFLSNAGDRTSLFLVKRIFVEQAFPSTIFGMLQTHESIISLKSIYKSIFRQNIWQVQLASTLGWKQRRWRERQSCSLLLPEYGFSRILYPNGFSKLFFIQMLVNTKSTLSLRLFFPDRR